MKTPNQSEKLLHIISLNVYNQDALSQSGIATLSQRREEVCVNFIKREGSSSPLPNALVPHVSIKRPYHGQCVVSL